MIAEAVGTVVTLGWALAAWITAAALVAAVVLHTVAGIVWWAWRVVRAAWAAAASFSTHSRRCSASDGAGGGFPAPDPERPAEARTAPSWARTDKEAA